MQKSDYALLLLRVGFGLSMVAHGWNKIFSSNGITGTSGWFASLGMRWPTIQARTAAYSELAAGLLMVAGLLTGLAATIFVSLMLVAIITVHWKVGYFIFLPNGGWEYCAAIIVMSASLSLSGPGRISLDHVWEIPNDYSVFAVPLGVLLALCHVAISFRPTPPTN